MPFPWCIERILVVPGLAPSEPYPLTILCDRSFSPHKIIGKYKSNGANKPGKLPFSGGMREYSHTRTNGLASFSLVEMTKWTDNDEEYRIKNIKTLKKMMSCDAAILEWIKERLLK